MNALAREHGVCQASAVGPGDHIYGPGLKPRPAGELYCRNCLRTLDGPR